jgi:WD40 repeat protein
MNTDDLREETILEQALSFAGVEARLAYLQGACRGDSKLRARLEALIAAHEAAGGFLAEPALTETLSDCTPLKAEHGPGTVIGRYKLLQQIGEGGCGVVYMAEQEEPVRRRVAVKVIKLGMDTKNVIARFEAERQALAMMDHPNIAKVLDAGATESGRPYFVMELVRGVKITDYCDQNNLATSQRLELFVQICRSIQHAHQKGIIHRDIKPSNILVTLHDGLPVPKVIDFGIAKATAHQRLTDKTLFTQFEQFIGTPAYMSPEQAEMSGLDIDTRTDIYSLGVLLYELLTGKTPFDATELVASGLDEMRKTIREKEPLRPSTRLGRLEREELTTTAKRRGSDAPRLIHLLQGDLDWIVMKALEKDRTRRYETVNGLAMDIQRYLNQEVVVARPPSATYRLQKIIRRNRLAFTAGAGIVAALLVGTVVSTWQAVRAIRLQNEQSKLRQAAEKAEATASVQERLATRRAVLAEQERKLARQNAYLASMLLAQADWDNNNLIHLRQVLAETRDYPDRGFEWYYWQQLCHLESKVLSGHLTKFYNLQFLPDSRRVLTVSEDQTAKLWDTVRGTELFTLKGHRQVLRHLAVSPDGRLVATGTLGGDSSTIIWDAATGQEVVQLPPHQGRALAFSPNSRRIATLTDDSLARIWEARTGELFHTFPGFVAMSQDLERVVTTGRASANAIRGGLHSTAAQGADLAAGLAGWLDVWEVNTGRRICAIPNTFVAARSGDGASTITWFSPDGRKLVAGNGPIVEVWDLDTGSKLFDLKGHASNISWARFSADGQRIFTSSVDDSTRVWDARTGRELLALAGSASAISPDSLKVLTSNKDGSATIWEVESGLKVRTLVGRIDHSTFSPDGRWVATGHEENALRIWDTEKQPGLLVLKPNTSKVRSIVFSPDGQRLASGGDDQIARVWETETGQELLSLRGHSGGIRAVAYSPDGRRLATASEDNTVGLWDSSTGRLLNKLEGHRNGVWAAAFSPDSRYLVTGSVDRTARLWEVATGNELRSFKGHKRTVTAVAFSPDGKMLVTASMDRTAKVWSTGTGLELHALTSHEDGVTCVSFAPDGRRIATASLDETVKLWGTDATNELTTLSGHAGKVRSVAFSPDGRRVAAAGDNNTVFVWDVGMNKELLVLRGHSNSVSSVAFSPDSRSVASGGTDGTIRIWAAASDALSAQWEKAEHTAQERLNRLAEQRARDEQLARTARFGDEGAIRHWLVLAPMPLDKNESCEHGLDRQQVPDEAKLRPTGGVKVPVNGRELVWDEVHLADSATDLGVHGWTRQFETREVNFADTDYVIDFNQLLGGEWIEYSVAYAVCYIQAETDLSDLKMLIGSDDQSKVYLNGVPKYEYRQGRSMVADAAEVNKVRLNRGSNVLLFKVVNGTAGWQGSVRFTDKDGHPVKGIHVTLAP